MLHILLLILKWIGIVLAVFLLLVLLLINLGLFVPIRYRADASCQNDIETLEAEFELSWMWKLFFLTACWKKGKADMKIRIGWKYLFSEEKEGKSEEKIEVPEEKEENDLQKEKEEQKFLKEQKESLPPEKTNRSLPENNVQEQAEKRECRQQKTESGIDKEEEEKESFTADRRKAGGRKKKPLWDRMKEKISEWIESCKSFWRKILAIGRNLRGKKEQIESFLTGMLFPFLGENTVIVPDFENKVLEGSVHIEGKIHNFRMLAILWRLIKDRDVRKIIIDVKKLKW